MSLCAMCSVSAQDKNKKDDLNIIPSIEFEVADYSINKIDFHLLKWLDSTSIIESDHAMLRWVVKGAESVVINPDIGSVGARGFKLVQPNSNTRYTLVAKNLSGRSVSKKVAIEVKKLKRVVELKVAELAVFNSDVSQDLIRLGKPALPYLISELKKIMATDHAVSSLSERRKFIADRNKAAQIILLLPYYRETDAIPVIKEILEISDLASTLYGDLFSVLKVFGKDDSLKAYAISKLVDTNSHPLLIRAALDYLATQDKQGLELYALKFMEAKYDFRVREMAVYLAAHLAVPNIKESIISLLNEKNKLRNSFFDLYALARIAAPNEFKADMARVAVPTENELMTIGFSRVKAAVSLLEAFNKNYQIAENLSFFYHAESSKKDEAVERLMQSGSAIEKREAFRYIFSNNRLDLLEKYHLIPSIDERKLFDSSIQAGMLVRPLPEYLFDKETQALIFAIDGMIIGSAESPFLFIRH